MPLKVQIMSLLFSFLFGISVYFILELFSKFIYNKIFCLKIISSFFFSLLVSFLYFVLLLYINNGVLHIYFFIMIIIGYTLANFVYVKLFVKK